MKGSGAKAGRLRQVVRCESPRLIAVGAAGGSNIASGEPCRAVAGLHPSGRVSLQQDAVNTRRVLRQLGVFQRAMLQRRRDRRAQNADEEGIEHGVK